MTIQTRPLAASIGAEVEGVDLNALVEDPGRDDTLGALQRALDRHLVLVIRDQRLSPAQYLRAAGLFGDTMPQHISDYLMPEHPHIAVLDSRKTRVGAEGRAIPLGARAWHTDHTNHARPPRYTILYALALPERGGDTGFANMQLAYERLPDATRARLDTMRTVNVIENNDYVSSEHKQRYGVPQIHPLVRTHPNTGRKAIYVHPGKLAHIDGMSPAQSHDFVRELLEQGIGPDNTYRHSWRVGDMLICDNRAVMHLAYQDYDPAEKRILHRLIIEGEVPH
ncbi:MAG: TauD/TfdA family dioxygenase [Gammaproteobacteria bacterium]|nr:TauD/TfdA family dioxygenase [Gammaproteobacteria bacterium]